MSVKQRAVAEMCHQTTKRLSLWCEVQKWSLSLTMHCAEA